MLLPPESKAVILNAALYSPSADNSQPWKYAWHLNGNLSIYSDAQLSGEATDRTYVLTDLAIGGVLEAITLQAISLGINANITYFPDSNPMHVAKVNFSSKVQTDSSEVNIELAKQIPHRHSDRRFPFGGKIDSDIAQQLSASLNNDNYQLITLTNKKGIAPYVSLIKKAESIRFKSQALHAELFQSVHFGKLSPSQGMTLKMLAIEPFARPIFRYISKWRNMRKFNMIGGANLIAIRSVVLPIKLSPALCMLTISGENRVDILQAGQQMLRFWLQATKLEISVHPYAAPGVLTLAKPSLDDTLLKELNEVEKGLTQLIGQGKKAIMFYRIGYKKGLPETSQRRDIQSMLKEVMS